MPWEREGYDEEWQAQWEARQRAVRAQYMAQSAAVGFATGAVVGSAGYVLQTRRFSKGAVGAGLFLGVILGVGSAMRAMQ